MDAFVVYTKLVRGVNSEYNRETLDVDLARSLGSGRDYFRNETGEVYKVIEKVLDQKSNEYRVLVRAA